MSEPLSPIRIGGVALLLFSSILLGVGMHHLIATGTCSSTGYSPNLGPVRHCPSGTGAWFGFVFGGIIGALVGGLMTGGSSLFGGIFGGIGVGALTLGFQHGIDGSTKTFGIAFGAPFTLVGLVAGGYALWTGVGALRDSAGAGGGGGSAASASSRSRHPSRGSSRVATNAIAPPPLPRPVAPTAPAFTNSGFTSNVAGSTASLTQLAELHSQGVLTDAEFAAAKAKVLGGVSA